MKRILFAIVLVMGLLALPVTAANNGAPKPPPNEPVTQYATQKEYFDLLRAVLDTAKENNEHLKTTITVGGMILALIVALFAFFGYREMKSFLSPLKTKLSELEVAYSEKSSILAKKLEEKIHGDIRALLEAGFAVNLIGMSNRDGDNQPTAERKQSLLNSAVSHLDKALNRDSPEDPALIAYIQANRGYVLKRLNRLPEAYDAAVSAFNCTQTLEENGATHAFNAACYACLQDKKDDALHWLKIAVKLDGHNMKDAWDEKDFDHLRSDPLFKEICGQRKTKE